MGTPVHHQFTVHIAAGQAIFNANVSVLAGKALVIEHVSGKISLPSGQVPIVSVVTSAFQINQAGTQTGTHFFPVTIHPSGSGQSSHSRPGNANSYYDWKQRRFDCCTQHHFRHCRRPSHDLGRAFLINGGEVLVGAFRARRPRQVKRRSRRRPSSSISPACAPCRIKHAMYEYTAC